MDVRRYQDADAPQLAALLERNSYGPSEYRDVLGLIGQVEALEEQFAQADVQRCV